MLRARAARLSLQSDDEAPTYGQDPYEQLLPEEAIGHSGATLNRLCPKQLLTPTGVLLACRPRA
jgi:hypothetical protein